MRQAQDIIKCADHLLIMYLFWLGSMPALFKAFLEQVLIRSTIIGSIEGMGENSG